MKTRLVIIILISLSFVLSCGDDYNFKITQKRLTSQAWHINTFVDYSQNSTVDIRSAKYIFENDGELMKIYENNDTVLSSWSLSQNPEFLTMGGNVFRITELTNRVMSLRYGEVEIFFISMR